MCRILAFDKTGGREKGGTVGWGRPAHQTLPLPIGAHTPSVASVVQSEMEGCHQAAFWSERRYMGTGVPMEHQHKAASMAHMLYHSPQQTTPQCPKTASLVGPNLHIENVISYMLFHFWTFRGDFGVGFRELFRFLKSANLPTLALFPNKGLTYGE